MKLLQLFAINIKNFVSRHNFYLGQQTSRITENIGDALFNITCCDTNFVDNLAMLSDVRLSRKAA